MAMNFLAEHIAIPAFNAVVLGQWHEKMLELRAMPPMCLVVETLAFFLAIN